MVDMTMERESSSSNKTIYPSIVFLVIGDDKKRIEQRSSTLQEVPHLDVEREEERRNRKVVCIYIILLC